jgi:hypothetical protein
MYTYIFCFVCILLLHVVTSTTPQNWKPYFNKNKWPKACQRIHTPDGKFLDLEYFLDSSVGVQVETVYEISFKSINTTKYWMAVSPTRFKKLSYQEHNYSFIYSVSNGTWIYYSQTYHAKPDGIYLIGSLNNFYNSSLPVEQNIQFSHYFALNNSLFILVLVFSRSPLCRRRSAFAIISNTCLLLFSIVNMVEQFTQKIYYAKNLLNDRRRNIIYQSMRTGSNLFCFAIVAVYCFQLYRYFQIRHIYSIVFNNKYQNRFFKGLLSRKVYSIVFVCAIMLLHTTVFIVFVIGMNMKTIIKYKQGRSSLFIFTPESDYLMVIEVFILLIPFALDFLFNLKKIWNRGVINYFTSDDPLLYRFETLLILIILPCYVPYSLPSTIFKTTAGSCTYTVFLSIMLQLIAGNGFIALIELFRYFKSKLSGKNTISVEQQEDVIVTNMKNDQFYKIFSRYCLRELSFENVEAWKVLQVAKDNDYIEREQFNELYSKFISNNSDIQVNISSKTKKVCDQIHASDVSDSIL